METTPCCREAEQWVREHPGEALLAGAGAGFLLAQFPLRCLTRLFKHALLCFVLWKLAKDFFAQRN